MAKHSIYASYLVRIWREPGNWRGEVESIQTGLKWEFTSLDRMFDFLRAQIEAEPSEKSRLLDEDYKPQRREDSEKSDST